MDLRAFYQKIREVENTITGVYTVVVSKVTPDGGRAGVKTEVVKSVAARLVVEDKARLATVEEAQQHLTEIQDARSAAEQAVLASRVQLAIIPESELRSLKDRVRPQKG
jgi:hypothetical protein